MKGEVEVYIDGAARGNPGDAAVGGVFKSNQKTIKEISEAIGTATNNVAEYVALIKALKEAINLKLTKLKIYTDSELLYKQITGRYKVKNENLKSLFDQAQHLAKEFESLTIQQIPREKNKDADKLANQAFQVEKPNVVASLFKDGGEESPSSKG